MGIICSNQTAIDNTRFTALRRATVHKAESVLLLERAGDKTGPTAAIVKLATGEFTVLGMRHTPNGDWADMGYGASAGDKRVLSALVKMGAITQTEMDAHVAAVEARAAAKDREWAMKSLESACATLGIPVPDVTATTEG